MYMATLSKRDPAIDMFLDQREEERFIEEERLALGEDDGWLDSWGSLFSSEALVDEMDRLSDISNDLDNYTYEWDLD